MSTYQEIKADVAKVLGYNTDDFCSINEMFDKAEEDASFKPYHGDGPSPMMQLRMNEFATIAKMMARDRDQEGEQ